MISRRRWADNYLLFLAILPFVFFSFALSTHYLIAGEDALTFNLPPRAYEGQLLRSLEFPLWDEYSYAGSSFFADPQNAAAYPLTVLLFLLLPPVLAFNLHVIIHHSLAGIFTYLFARSLRLRPAAALLPALSFMFCGYLVAHQQHIQNHASVVWLPAVLASVQMFRRERRPLWLLLAAVSYAMLTLSGYPQITLYSTVIIVFYIVTFFWRVRKGRELLRAFLAIVAGLALSAVWLLPTLLTYEQSSRSDFNYYLFNSHKFYPHLLFNYLMPYFYGSAGGSSIFKLPYWGDPGTEFYHEEVYIGLLPIFFAILAVFVRVRAVRQKCFWITIAVVSLVLSLRMDNVLTQMLYHVPLYDKMRGHGRQVVYLCFALSILAGLGLNELLRMAKIRPKQFRNRAALLTLIAGVLFLASMGFVVLHRQLFNLLMENPPFSPFTSSGKLISPEVILPLAFFLVYAFLFLCLWKKKHFHFWLIPMFIVLLLDLFMFARFYSAPDNAFERLLENPQNRELLRLYEPSSSQKERIYMLFAPPWDIRVLPFPRVNQMLGIPLINGYNPLVPKDVVQILRMNHYGWALNAQALALNNNVLSLLNVRYIAADDYGKPALEDAKAITSISKSELSSLGYVMNPEKRLASWKVEAPSRSEDSKLFLAGGLPAKPAVAKHPVSLEADRTYRVSFEARFCGSQYRREYLFIKFDPEATELDLHSDGFFPDVQWQSFESYLYADRALENAALEFYTYSSAGFSVRNVTVQSLLAHPVFWGTLEPEERGRRLVPLYRKVLDLGKDRWLYENRNVLPSAFLVDKVKIVRDISLAKRTMFHSAGLFDPSREALVEPRVEKSLPDIDNLTTGTVEIISRGANHIGLKTKSAGNSFLVVSDRFDPGWKAYVDGFRAKIYRTNGLVQGVFISGGGHNVNFVYSPDSLWLGLVISAAALVLLLLLCVILPRFGNGQSIRGSGKQ
jgi:hypothetical protein